MTAMQPRFSRRSIALAVALASVASLAIGVHAGLSTRALNAAKAIATGQSGDAENKASRIALETVIIPTPTHHSLKRSTMRGC